MGRSAGATSSWEELRFQAFLTDFFLVWVFLFLFFVSRADFSLMFGLWCAFGQQVVGGRAYENARLAATSDRLVD